MDTIQEHIKPNSEHVSKYRIIFILYVSAMLCAGAFFIYYEWTNYVHEANERAIVLAESVTAFLSSDQVNKLEANPNDLEKPEYKQIKNSLVKFKDRNKGISFAYLYTLKNERIYFMVDSEFPDSEGYSPPGQEYIEATQTDKQPFMDGKSVITKPTTDRWGTWVSALVPIKDQQTGKVIAVLGVDYPAKQWYGEAVTYVVLIALVVMSIILLILAFYWAVMKNKVLTTLSDKLKESERSKATLISNLPGMAYRCNYDRDWTMQFISDGCFELTGYKPESLLYNKDLAFNDLISPEYREVLWNEWARIIEAKEIFKYEYTITTASGDVKWVFEQGQPIYDENGEVEALEGLIIDITELKNREMEIQYLSTHDFLTGLYNRRFYEMEKARLDAKGVLPLSIIIADINGLKLINDAFGHAEGDKLIIKTANILSSCCRAGDVLARTGGDEFGILLPNTDSETVYEIIRKIEKACEHKMSIPERYTIQLSLGYGTKETREENIQYVEKIAEDYMYKRKLLERKSYHSSVLTSIMATLYARSQETEEHAKRLALLTRKIAKTMNLPQKTISVLELFAMLHDIGKIGIDDRILNKPDKLTAEEWVVMKKHPEIGYRIAMSSPEFESIAEYILCHHERWDGKGYPQGLKGKEIPLLSRILAVADTYDAMTEDRPYRRAKTKEEAILEIKKNAGTQFDCHIVEIFINQVLPDIE